MAASPPGIHAPVIVDREHLQSLLAALLKRGYQVVGPTVRDNAIVYATLTSVDDLPAGCGAIDEALRIIEQYEVPEQPAREDYAIINHHNWYR